MKRAIFAALLAGFAFPALADGLSVKVPCSIRSDGRQLVDSAYFPEWWGKACGMAATNPFECHFNVVAVERVPWSGEDKSGEFVNRICTVVRR